MTDNINSNAGGNASDNVGDGIVGELQRMREVARSPNTHRSARDLSNFP
jgi:hypothetical protein